MTLKSDITWKGLFISNSRSRIISNSRSRSDGRSPGILQSRVDQSQMETMIASLPFPPPTSHTELCLMTVPVSDDTTVSHAYIITNGDGCCGLTTVPCQIE